MDKRVNPESFIIHESLTGQILASPLKRFGAGIIDCAIAYFLAGFSFYGLTAIGIVFSYWVAFRIKKNRIINFTVATIVSFLLLALFLYNLTKPILDVYFEVMENEDSDREETVLGDQETTLQNFLPQYEVPMSSSNQLSSRDLLIAFLGDFGIIIGWVGFYYILNLEYFNGQTVGKKIFGIKVCRLDGKDINMWSSFERFSGYLAGFFTGYIGFIQVFWDKNRQMIQDKIAETVVIDIRKKD